MSESKGYYSIIQYCPDPAKSEGVNVGVALFVPERGYASARMASNNNRARKFFGKSLDNERLKAAKKAIRNRIRIEAERFQQLGDIQTFVRRRADMIRLLDPKPMRVSDPQMELDDLFSELVEPERELTVARPHFDKVDSIFRAPEFEQRIKFDVAIEIPIARRQLHVPYSYRNGVDVYVLTREFKQRSQAEQIAIEGQLIRDKLNSRLLVVGATLDENDELREITKGLLDFSDVELYWEHEADRLRQKVKEDLQLST